VLRVGHDHFELQLATDALALANGDGLTYFDLQKNLVGLQANTVVPLGGNAWRVVPNEPIESLPGLKPHTPIHRNRDMAWERLLAKPSAERRIGVTLKLLDTADGFALEITDADGHSARAAVTQAHEPAKDAGRTHAMLRAHLGKLGNTIFEAGRIDIGFAEPWFVPVSVANALRRDAVLALEAARAAAFTRLPRARPVQPPAPYPGDALSYLANVYNHKAHDFYVKHGVQIVDAAYESHEELGEVSLMITKHCVRWSLSLCPKQAKGVTGVQGTVRAEPLTMRSGGDTLTLRFDCKPCEMHVVGKIRRQVLGESVAAPLRFYRSRPRVAA
jgi:putative protease